MLGRRPTRSVQSEKALAESVASSAVAQGHESEATAVDEFPYEIFEMALPSAPAERWIDPYPSAAVKPPADLPHGQARRGMKRGAK